jgi:hypothetical protein
MDLWAITTVSGDEQTGERKEGVRKKGTTG